MQKEEDQVRRQAPAVQPLRELQDGVCLHSSREEADASKRVRFGIFFDEFGAKSSGHSQLTSAHRAKYIEGLENRLGRMEHLLRLSGKNSTLWWHFA